MKKLLLIFTLLIGLFMPLCLEASAADIMPRYVSMKFTNTLGLYQAPRDIVLYQEPDEQSPLVMSIKWSAVDIFPGGIKFDDVFVVFIPSKELGLMAVTDETEEWVQVMYNNSTGDRGWMKKDDPYKFMTWINFYNMYGRKYGLKMLKGIPDEIKDLHVSTDEKSQTTGTLNMPQKINLNVIKGNWALVSVFDLDRVPKTGYIRWRADNGTKYFFPDMK